jgi:hypothetical protein
MIGFPLQELVPVSCLPESETLHVVVVISHRCVSVGRPLQVEINEFLEVRPHDLICIDEDDLLQVHWKEYVQVKNLVRPDNALLLCLRTQPGRPLVCDEFVLEVVCFGEVGNEFLFVSVKYKVLHGDIRRLPGKKGRGSSR